MAEFDYQIIIAKRYDDHDEVKYANRIPGRAMALLQELISIHEAVSSQPEHYEPDGFKEDWRK